MEMQDILREIKHLSQKQRSEGLTPQEQELQKELREQYMTIFRAAMRGHIEGLKIVDETGNDVTPEKLKQIQREKGLHGRSLDEENA